MRRGGQRSEVRGQTWLLAILFAAQRLCAASNSTNQDDLPVLNPPRGELPPTFWEQNSAMFFFAAAIVMTLTMVVIWWFLRPKKNISIPPEVQARRELKALRGQTEDGQTLSRVSRSLRCYVTNAFELPPDELTTTEFCQAVAAHEKIGGELAASLTEFLRRCDELKFAPSSSPPQIGAADRALELLELAETRRAWSLQQAVGANETARA